MQEPADLDFNKKTAVFQPIWEERKSLEDFYEDPNHPTSRHKLFYGGLSLNINDNEQNNNHEMLAETIKKNPHWGIQSLEYTPPPP